MRLTNNLNKRTSRDGYFRPARILAAFLFFVLAGIVFTVKTTKTEAVSAVSKRSQAEPETPLDKAAVEALRDYPTAPFLTTNIKLKNSVTNRRQEKKI